MIISELVAKLEELKAQHGDVEVYTEGGCGCCQWSRDPYPSFSVESPFDWREKEQLGVYL